MEYWKKRIRAEQEAKIAQELTLEKEYNRLHDHYFNNIQKEIDGFVQRYSTQNGLTKTAVNKKSSEMDVQAFADKAARYVKEKNFSPQANAELKLYNLKMKTSRAELLQYYLDLDLVALANEEHQMTERFLNEEYIADLRRQAGILGETLPEPGEMIQRAQAIVNAPYHGATWSENIWERQNLLRLVVAETVENSIMAGKSSLLSIPQLREEFNVTAYQARRLAVTETARIQSQVQKEAYLRNRYDEFNIVPEPTACELCKEVARKGPYKTDDMQPGLNTAPIHPHCKCTAHPEAGRDKLNEMFKELEALEDTPTGNVFNAKQLMDKTNMNKKYGKENYNQFVESLNNIDDSQTQQLYNGFSERMNFKKISDTQTAHYDTGDDIINLNQKAFSGDKYHPALQTVFHENGHAIDKYGLEVMTGSKNYLTGEKTEFKSRGKTYERDVVIRHASALPKYNLKETIDREMWEAVNGELPMVKDIGSKPRKKVEKEIWTEKRFEISTKSKENASNFIEKMKDYDTQSVSGLSDIAESTGYFPNDRPFGSGHGAKYWKTNGMAETEFYAHVSEAIATNPKAYELLEQTFPKSLDIYRQINDDILSALDGGG